MFAGSRLASLMLRRCTSSMHTTAASLGVVQVIFPAVAESVKDGIVKAIHVQPGQAVVIDQELITIDTDKVAVDLRAEVAGVVKGVYAQVAETVPVKKLLVEIDSDAKATTAPTQAAPAAPAPTPAPAKAEPPVHRVDSASTTHHRVPSIKFRYGKRETSPSAKPNATTATDMPHYVGNYNQYLDSIMPSKASKTIFDLPPAFGRPKLTPAEIAAIESGGAY